MENNTEAYVIFVVLGVVLVIAVGQFLVNAGRDYLQETFPDPRVATSVSRLLTVLFYLFALGVLGIISTMDVPVDGAAQTVVTKLGVVLLVLGIVFAGTMAVLSRIRSRRQEEEQSEAMMAAYTQDMTAEMPEAHGAGPMTSTSPTSGQTTAGPTDARVVRDQRTQRPPTV